MGIKLSPGAFCEGCCCSGKGVAWELCVNPLVSSPLLIGFFHPCIVLPSADIPEKDFRCIVLHAPAKPARYNLSALSQYFEMGGQSLYHLPGYSQMAGSNYRLSALV